MASLSDVAKAAGVSLTTASLVLNRPKQPNRVSEACAQRVRGVAKTLGYIPNYHARSMKLGRAETIAVALDVGGGRGAGAVSELTDAYFNHLIGGIELHLRNVGYQMTLIGPDEHAKATERALQGLGQRRFDGMIVLGVVIHPANDGLLAESPDGAIVAIEYAGPTSVPVVEYDERHGVELAVGHLSRLGHKRLLWVGPEGSDLPQCDGAKREALYREAAAWQGLHAETCPFPLKCEAGIPLRISQLEQARQCVADYLRERPRDFTGVVAYNDPVAIGVCRALRDADLDVPGDVSVVGFDDIEAPFCIPPLTSVSHRLLEMGRRAAERVMEMVNDESSRARLRGTREVVEPELVVRKSTGQVLDTGEE